MRGRRLWRFLRSKHALRGAILAVLFTSLWAAAASRLAAQSCALCYQSAAASGTAGRMALRHGIVVLLLPGISLFLGIFALIYHRRNSTR